MHQVLEQYNRHEELFDKFNACSRKCGYYAYRALMENIILKFNICRGLIEKLEDKVQEIREKAFFTNKNNIDMVKDSARQNLDRMQRLEEKLDRQNSGD